MADICAPGSKVLWPMLIGLVTWPNSRPGFRFGSGHLSKRACLRAQTKARLNVHASRGNGRLGGGGCRWGRAGSSKVCRGTGKFCLGVNTPGSVV